MSNEKPNNGSMRLKLMSTMTNNTLNLSLDKYDEVNDLEFPQTGVLNKTQNMKDDYFMSLMMQRNRKQFHIMSSNKQSSHKKKIKAIERSIDSNKISPRG